MYYDLELFTRNLIDATTPNSSKEFLIDKKTRVNWNLEGLDEKVTDLLRFTGGRGFPLLPSEKVLIFEAAIRLARSICEDCARTLEDRKELLSKSKELSKDGSSLIQEWQEKVKKIQGNAISNPHRGTIGHHLPFLISSWNFAKKDCRSPNDGTIR
jgi:hypothetical protein